MPVDRTTEVERGAPVVDAKDGRLSASTNDNEDVEQCEELDGQAREADGRSSDRDGRGGQREEESKSGSRSGSRSGSVSSRGWRGGIPVMVEDGVSCELLTAVLLTRDCPEAEEGGKERRRKMSGGISCMNRAVWNAVSPTAPHALGVLLRERLRWKSGCLERRCGGIIPLWSGKYPCLDRPRREFDFGNDAGGGAWTPADSLHPLGPRRCWSSGGPRTLSRAILPSAPAELPLVERAPFPEDRPTT